MTDSKESRYSGVLVGRIKTKVEKYLNFFEYNFHSHPFLAVIALFFFSVVVVIVWTLKGKAEINDLWEAFNDLREPLISNLKYIPIFFALLLFSIVGLIFRREIMLVWALLKLRKWCREKDYYKVGEVVAERSREVLLSWTEYLDPKPDVYGKRRFSGVAFEALISSYLGGLRSIRVGKPLSEQDSRENEKTDRLLPSNFLLYAHCVEQIRRRTAEEYPPGHRIKVGIRTLLTGDINRWYNIQRLHLPPDEKTLWCSTNWWERYKTEIKNESLLLTNICLHRLLRNDGMPEIENSRLANRYMRLALRTGKANSISYRDFIEAKKELEKIEEFKKLKWLGGVQHITDNFSIPNVLLHPICEIDDEAILGRLLNWGNAKFEFSSAFETYRASHNFNGDPSSKPLSPGAWGKHISKSNLPAECNWIRDYDDLFLLEFFDSTESYTPVGRFGISFRIEEHRDIAGIKLLSSSEVGDAIKHFDMAWETANRL